MNEDWGKYREKIIGLGESSSKKSYYPELQDKIHELEASHNNLLTIINSISDALLIHDLTGKILLQNKRAQEIFHIYEDEFESYSITDISSKQMNLEELKVIWNEAYNGKSQIFEWTAISIRNQEEFPVQVSVNSTFWNGKKVLVAVVRDFKERKKYEEELIVARYKAEENDRLKSAFLANISHEIRTPMNGILGFAELLKLPDLTGDQMTNYIQKIETCGIRMLNIISNIMDVSKLESGQMTVYLKDVDVDKQMNHLFELFISETENKGLQFITRAPLHYKPTIIHTDQDKLNAILTNLIKNAIKYSHHGTIEFGYINKGKYIYFFVKDNGIGISKEKLPVIFERFLRGDLEMSAKYEGAGLGLTIARAYVELLGGEIGVESEKGVGSHFFFTLPILHKHSDKK